MQIAMACDLHIDVFYVLSVGIELVWYKVYYLQHPDDISTLYKVQKIHFYLHEAS